MFVSKAGFSIHIFDDNHIESVVNLIASSFVKNNPVWRAYEMQYNKAQHLIRFNITKLTKNSISFVLKDQDQKIVGCIMNIDLCNLQSNQIFNAKNCIDSIKEIQAMELFQNLSKVDLEFFKKLQTTKVQPGSIYNYYVAIDESIKNQGLASYMYQATLNCLKLAGITEFYVRVTNPITYKIMNRMGAKELNRYIINVPEKGLHNFTTYFMHISLSKFKLQRECL